MAGVYRRIALRARPRPAASLGDPVTDSYLLRLRGVIIGVEACYTVNVMHAYRVHWRMGRLAMEAAPKE